MRITSPAWIDTQFAPDYERGLLHCSIANHSADINCSDSHKFAAAGYFLAHHNRPNRSYTAPDQ